MEQTDLAGRIVHFDRDFCVVTKFAGENSQSDIPKIFQPEINRRLVENEIFSRKTPEVLECPHRLDMGVSGVQIICFSRFSLKFFSEQFSHNHAQKTYLAIVEGTDFPLTEKTSTLSNYLIFVSKKKKAFIYDTEKNGSKECILDYRIFGAGQKYSYVEVFPKTGRTHQIRAQLAHNGMHIKGDVKYGARRTDSIPGIRLFAYSISIPVPKNSLCLQHANENATVTFKSEIPVCDNLWKDCFDAYEKR